MPDFSARLGLPFLMPAQAQKHVTHNEALTLLDLLVQLVVQGFEAADPPAAPEDGQIWALGPAPTGAWAGQAGRLAGWVDGGWLFVTPRPGWRAVPVSEPVLRIYDGAGWVPPSAGAMDNVPGLGVNASHDAVNRLVLSSAASLFTHEGAGHQLKINKASASDTASLLFQTGFSGRAEFGLTGNDDWSVKVSPDGVTWHDVLNADSNTGTPGFPNGATIAGTEAYRRGNILGAVSQAAGVPTGAVIERGSNDNGSFVRFADGTQICTRSCAVNHGATGVQEFPWAANFVVAPGGGWNFEASTDLARIDRLKNCLGMHSATHAALAIGTGGTVTETLEHIAYAIGRWV